MHNDPWSDQEAPPWLILITLWLCFLPLILFFWPSIVFPLFYTIPVLFRD